MSLFFPCTYNSSQPIDTYYSIAGTQLGMELGFKVGLPLAALATTIILLVRVALTDPLTQNNHGAPIAWAFGIGAAILSIVVGPCVVGGVILGIALDQIIHLGKIFKCVDVASESPF